VILAADELLPALIGATAVAAAVALGLILVVVREKHRQRDEGVGQAQRPAGRPPPRTAELADRLEQLSRRLAADLDERTGEMERLLKEADARISELRRLSPAAGEGRYEPNGEGDARRAEVRRLCGRGLEPVEIARRMQMDVGEVELMINLSAPSAGRDGP
jgi:hypothetical protein